MDAFLALDDLQATARHIQLLDRKLETLTNARADSWSQMLAAAARLFRAGQMDRAALIELHASMKHSYGPGFSRVWDEHMPIPSNRVLWFRMDVPNGPMGSFIGTIPIGSANPCPPGGMAVVYVLFDAANEPIYVGSTDAFRDRLRVHRKEKPEARQWTAYPCRDRKHAYDVEDRLLKEHKPRMNKRAAR